uniref:Ig-like domain-containing protein n=1 Tax=Sinocyclocheilus grahami TaxID=75366 RepID=A0A672M0P8_SINGR
VETDGMSAYVMEGDSVILHTDVKMNHQDRIRWYFNKTLIAQIIGVQSKICSTDQCKERFRNRLKLDSHTVDLTITNTRTTDSGVYKLQIIRRRVIHKIFNVQDKVKRKSVKEGESLTLHPGVIKNPNHVMTFRDKLDMNSQTGSLTITNIRTTHSGQYKVKIVHSINHRHRISIISVKTFMSVMEGDSVCLYTGLNKSQQERIKWYFNSSRIAEITGDESKICTDDQCDERFRDRLEVDHQTGSLTITNTRTTDSGLYYLQINSSRFSIIRSFSVTITGE